MSIPFNDNLLWNSYQSNPDWYKSLPAPTPALDRKTSLKGEVKELFAQSVIRGVQFIRDGARLVLKVPIRAIWTPIVLEKNWKQLERAKINAKLAGYSFVQAALVPAKFLAALAARVTAIFTNTPNWLRDKTECFDGRASQLEALKEEAGKHAQSREEYNKYREWLYNIDPKLCRK